MRFSTRRFSACLTLLLLVAAVAVLGIAMPRSTAGEIIDRAVVKITHKNKPIHANFAWGESPSTYLCHICPSDCPLGTEGVDWWYCGG